MADIAFLVGATLGGTLVLLLLSWLLDRMTGTASLGPGARAASVVGGAYALLFLFLGATADPGGYGWATGLFYAPAAAITWWLRRNGFRRREEEDGGPYSRFG